MEKIRDATLPDLIRAIVVREYNWGKTRFKEGIRDNFYALFYVALDDGVKSPARVVAEGRAEVFAEMPEGIQWGVWRFTPEDLDRMLVINSSGWNRHPADFTVPERERAIWEGKMGGVATQERIIQMLEHAEETFAPEKMPVLVAKSGSGPWTVLEGNHTMIALHHAYKEQGVLLRRDVLIGILPQDASYRFFREGALNTVPTGKNKSPEDIARIRFPRFVEEAIREADRE
jgi:hypothetical protein